MHFSILTYSQGIVFLFKFLCQKMGLIWTLYIYTCMNLGVIHGNDHDYDDNLLHCSTRFRLLTGGMDAHFSKVEVKIKRDFEN